MKFCTKLLAVLFAASTCLLISCSGPGSAFTYQNVTISLTYYPICNGCGTTTANSGFYYGTNPAGFNGITQTLTPVGTSTETIGTIVMPAGGGSGGCIELQTTVTNAPLNPTYTIIPAPNPASASSNVGTLGSQIGGTVFYCGPGSPAIFSSAQLVQAQANGIPEGSTEVMVTNPADPNNPSNVVSANLKFSMQVNGAPTGVLAGILQAPSVIVPLNGTFQFTGYIAGANGPVGSAQIPANAQTWAVSACSGGPALVVNANGTSNYGQINTTTGLYTAPAAYPAATYKCANITVASTAYPTIVSGITTVNFP